MQIKKVFERLERSKIASTWEVDTIQHWTEIKRENK